MKIDGGYILLSRKIDDSDVMKMPPSTREIWLYILRKVNHSEYRNLKRGENIFNYKDIQDDLCWFVGYRKVKYSKSDVAKSIRRLREGNMINTMKATRGVIIKVLHYDTYQTPSNYEGHCEEDMKDQRRLQSGSMKYKKEKNNNNILHSQEFRKELTLLGFSIKQVNIETDKMIDWLASTGKRYKDYKAFARNWMRRILTSKVSVTSEMEVKENREIRDREYEKTQELLNRYRKEKAV